MLSVHRVMGSETEFGLSQPGNPRANPMRDSARVVDAYAGPRGLRSSQNFWDFATESPLADARGFFMNIADADSSQLTHVPAEDVEAQYLANVVTENGARYYVDHAHPEYSSPEVLTPRDLVAYDRAGDLVALASVRALEKSGEPVNLYKNNTDSKGSSYGTHENYLVDRGVDFDDIVAGLIPFFVTRQILCGSGRVGIGREGESAGFQISSRADFFEAEVGLETTLRRPIVNTRDEPHADPAKYRRLHVIIGDATMAEPATLVRFGSTSLVLGLIEAGLAPRLELADPLQALWDVSHDLDLAAELPLSDGSTMTALQVQEAYYSACAQHAGDDEDTASVLAEWRRFLDGLAEDPRSLADSIDWVAKWVLLESYREREGIDWDHPKLALVDVQYHDVRPEKGLFHKLEQAGRIRRLTTDAEVEAAVTAAPEGTRAYLRSLAITRFSADLVAASWDSLVLNAGDFGVVRLPMSEPLKGTRALLEDRLSGIETSAGLLEALGVDRLKTKND
ncbi:MULTISPECIES: depupylase/deamidase Dop [unclassified Brevibacterium]|uniref:depupylase/deamidase Dop n=1 Tax=unclassified Brevibacterium TaxID=2614124 RepID=UPI001E5F8216|nr:MULTISPECIES: depupylase/deamidase Dop [unclassified Brevibacterium]MCD1284868.1 proteasome accessory factor PafA2 [Brevibacterium sp. CCUG 69071]MDK8435511.1 depupylase/deamidase Dop [Brevibacterium sp. H-BE7]